jgi:myo-inositol-1(or 4)-monophosphatase
LTVAGIYSLGMERQLLRTAEDACRAAAAVHRKYQREGFTTSSKSVGHDRVTDADLEAESVIVQIIETTFPDHAILAEEGGRSDSDSPYLWLVDPLDGTSNYSRGIPYYSVSVCVVHDDVPLVGTVYDPSRDELFSAIAGKGAYLNGESIAVSDTASMADAMLITGFYYDRGAQVERNLENIGRLFTHGIVGIRRLGSAALDLCYVACGRADAFWEHELKAWDFAAGALIVREAGGTVTDSEGNALRNRPSYVVASNTRLHEPIRLELRPQGE